MADLELVLADLLAEYDDLDSILASLPDSDWTRATPADGWTIAHQVAHLAWTDRASLIAATDAAGFDSLVQAAMSNPTGFVDEYAAAGAAQQPAELLQEWRTERAALVTALRAVPEGTKLPWYGPPMSPTSMATARLMETWAHGQDVADALHITRTPTARLRQVAFIGVRTRDFSYILNNVPVPTEPFRVELSAPDGELWAWGPPEATDRVAGSALDFCLLVTQRRHLEDLDVTATGPAASQWLGFAQAFAGAPGPGRPPAAAQPVDPASDR